MVLCEIGVVRGVVQALMAAVVVAQKQVETVACH